MTLFAIEVEYVAVEACCV